MTLRGKIAIAMAVLTAFTAIIVAVSTYAVTDNRVRSEVDQYLDGYAQRFQDPDGRQAAVTCASTNIRRLPQGVQRDPEVIQGVAFQCLDKSGSVINTIGVGTLPVSEEDLAIAASGRNEITRTVNVNRKTWRVETVGVAQGGAIQIARDYGETNRVLSALRVWLSLIVVGAAAISALVGWLIARRATKPLVQLTDAAEEVASTGRLDVEVPEAGKDEPGRLARAFATMLAALGQSRDQQQQLVQDAGHELRTPLTSLRTNVETLQRYPDLPVETRDVILSDLQSETRELGALVDELVQLATDTWDDEPEESVSLDLIAERVAERTRRRTGRVVELDVQSAVMIGRPRELTRAIGNLVDNAAKFSDDPTPVEVMVRPGIVVVRDHGPGINAEDQPHLFDRFYRAADARSKPGSGLGLAIVDQIVRAHGGTVTAANAPDGGAVFTIKFLT
ncbi:MAG: HAMP domain-containing sensor histidine kinase [Actinobacteria bacterium]|nr:HAMP domain-containing sensor histidine kinase [Actinomycetota bacterium]